VAKVKKARRNNQMDLFGGDSAASETPARPAANVAAKESAAEKAALPGAEPAHPPAATALEEPVKPTENAADKVPAQSASESPAPKPPPDEQSVTPDAESRPASAGAAAALPVISGLATADGLARAYGNPKLYLKALRLFAEQQAGAPEKIRDALVQGNAPAAERIVQALKTAADNIGATAVHSAAATLARAIHEQSDPGEMEFLWAELEKTLSELAANLTPVLKSTEDKPAPARRLPAPPPVNPAQLRKAVSLMMPLLADADPGAKDCLRDNRATFRSAFTAEAYVEFEQLVKDGGFSAALEHLKKAAKKYA
jgi:HPt (histidine-containing phosphotransfer) domain-containing protein